MKYDIIKTDNYLLVVNDEEIKYDDHYIDEYKMLYMLKNGDVTKHKNPKKIIAHLPLNNSSILEGVDLLPPLEDDVEQLAEYSSEIQEATYTTQHKITYKHGFTDGYNKAKRKYKWTDEDIANAITIAKNSMGDGETCYSHLSTEQIIQSIQQPKYPIAFECETWYNEFAGIRTNKTITNPQNNTQWVGKYIYQ